MKTCITAVLIALAAGSLAAAPVSFTSTTHNTSAFADVAGTADGPNAAISPPDALPIASSAGVTGAAGSASAAAAADGLALSATAAAASLGGPALAAGAATFLGAFTTTSGTLSLLLDFAGSAAFGGGPDAFADVLFSAILVVDGVTLFDESFVASALISEDFAVAGGLAGTLEITVAASALAVDPLDEAAAEAGLTFALDAAASAVPEPGALAIVLGGLLALALLHGRARLPRRG